MAKKKFEVNLERTPVIAVMGHVDHGKTSLLDSIRGTAVQEDEQGGITQNTRAHEVEYKGQKITFVDTPGHEAFSEMRSRGAKVTDMVLLVVAGDDGIQPQTKESIKFAQESGTPIIVAINKMDIQGINTDKIKNQLSQFNVLVEDYGGEVLTFETSATKKSGLDELLEGILLQAEMLELKKREPENGVAEAVVLESKLDNKLGPVALVLMRSGKIDDKLFISDGKEVTPVRAILDEYQNNIDVATEGQPIWLVGLNSVVETGTLLEFAETDKQAKKLLKEEEEEKKEQEKKEEEGEQEEVDELAMLASLYAQEQKDEEIKKLNVVIRTDSQGTLEVILNELEKLSDEEVTANVLSSGTGNITRKDILTAKNGHGIVLGFQVIVPSDLAPIVKQEKVLVRTYGVIYDLIDEVADALDGMLEPEYNEEEVARAKVKKVFVLSDGSPVAGSLVTGGKVIKGYKVWVERNGEEIGRGKITSLKHNKNEVKEMQKGTECGILVEPRMDIEEGDEVVLYKTVRN